jgi:hypothetical protein
MTVGSMLNTSRRLSVPLFDVKVVEQARRKEEKEQKEALAWAAEVDKEAMEAMHDEGEADNQTKTTEQILSEVAVQTRWSELKKRAWEDFSATQIEDAQRHEAREERKELKARRQQREAQKKTQMLTNIKKMATEKTKLDAARLDREEVLLPPLASATFYLPLASRATAAILCAFSASDSASSQS